MSNIRKVRPSPFGNTMASLFRFLVVFSLLLIGSSISSARKAPEEYWKEVMKDQPMPDVIGGLVGSRPQHPSKGRTKPDCQTSSGTKHSDFDETPNVTIYHGEAVTMEKKKFGDDFDETPNLTIYHGEAVTKQDKQDFVKDFEPRPNISVYHDDAETKQDKDFVKDFEPRPNISVYHGEDFEPRPNVSVYPDEGEAKSFVKDFEPRPNVSVYHE